MNGFWYIGIIPLKIYSSNVARHDNDWKILYYTEGSGILYAESREFNFKENDIFCLPPGTPHNEKSEKGFKNIHLIIKSIDIFDTDVIAYHDNYNQDYKNILMQIYNHYNSNETNKEKIISALLAVLAEYMISWNAQIKKNYYVDMCEQAIIGNISNYAFPLNTFIHNDIPMSYTYFIKLFKKETGYTPAGYFFEKRINYAKQLLLNNANNHVKKVRLKDIAGMCGFNDVYYFSRAFKKSTGYSPKQWQYYNNNNNEKQ